MVQDLKEQVVLLVKGTNRTLHFDSWDPPSTGYKVCNFSIVLADKTVFLRSVQLVETESHASVEALLEKNVPEIQEEYGIVINSILADNTAKVYGAVQNFVKKNDGIKDVACLNHSLMLVFKKVVLEKLDMYWYVMYVICKVLKRRLVLSEALKDFQIVGREKVIKKLKNHH